MTDKVQLPAPRPKFFDNDGLPLAGGKVFIWDAGSTSKVTTYTAADGLTENTNPIILDANGECDIWVDPLPPVPIPANPPGPPGAQGPQGIPGPPGATGTATEFSTTTDILSDDIYNNFFGEYIEVAPAPGAGYMLLPTQIAIAYHYRTVPFAFGGGGTFILSWGPPISPTSIPNATFAGTILTGTSDHVLVLPTADALNGQTIATFDAENKPITIDFSTAITGPPLTAIAINGIGSGYAVNDTGTIAGGTGGTYRVSAVSAGHVTTIVLTAGGSGYSDGTAVATATGGGQPGSGTGLTLDTTSAETRAGSLRVTCFYRKLVLDTSV